jgi:hypothetical protein
MLLSRHQNAGQNLNIKISNRCFENVAQFRYLGTTIKNKKLDLGENEEEIEFGECLLQFNPRAFVFSSAV